MIGEGRERIWKIVEENYYPTRKKYFYGKKEGTIVVTGQKARRGEVTVTRRQTPLRIFFLPSTRPFVPVVKADKECKHRGRGICHTSIGVRIDILRERETEAAFGAATIEGFRGKDR